MDKKYYQAGIRMEDEIWSRVLMFAAKKRISASEYCRQAIQEKIAFDEGEPLPLTEQRVKELIAVAFSERCLRCGGDVNVTGNITGGDLAINK